MTQQVIGRVERRRRETRTRLVAAARDLFAAQGLHETSISAIAERADVGLGTFYLHFADKDDLLAAIVADDEEAIAARIEAATAGMPGALERHRTGTRIYLEHAYERRYLFPILFDSVPATHPVLRAVRGRWWDATERLLTAGLEAGELRTDNSALLARALVVLVGQAALWWMDHDTPGPAEVAATVSAFIEGGLRRGASPQPEASGESR